MVLETAINNLITTYFGEPWILGLAVIVLFFIVAVSIGVPFESAAILSLPISIAIAANGLLSGYSWISDAILVIVGLAYGFLFLRMINR